jgi:hypothetical protein
MKLEEAIQQMINLIRNASKDSDVKTVVMSDEEARLSVYAPTGDMERIKVATFQPAIIMLNSEGLDIQVFVYDKDAPPLKG